MTPEERFLRQATKGLSRRKRAEVQAELASHLHERRSQLLLSGRDEAEISDILLQELGSPQQIAQELRRQEHVHPFFSGTVLFILFLLVAVAGTPFFTEQVKTHYSGAVEFPVPVEPLSLGVSLTPVSDFRGEGILSLGEARQVLKQMDIQLVWDGHNFLLRHSNMPDISVGHSYDCPPLTVLMDRVNLGNIWLNFPTVTMNINNLASCVAGKGWPVRITPEGAMFNGIKLPIIMHKDGLIKPDEANWVVWIESYLYRAKIEEGLKKLLISNPSPQYSGAKALSIFPYIAYKSTVETVKLDYQAHKLVGILFRAHVTEDDADFRYVITWVKPDNTVEIPKGTPDRPLDLHLVSNLSDWLNAPSGSGAAILIPLSTTVTDPINLTPIMPIK